MSGGPTGTTGRVLSQDAATPRALEREHKATPDDALATDPALQPASNGQDPVRSESCDGDLCLVTLTYKDGRRRYLATNKSFDDMDVVLRVEGSNIQSSKPLPYAVVIPPRETDYPLLDVTAADPSKGLSLRPTLPGKVGNPRASLRGAVLKLPYPARDAAGNALKYTCVQGFNNTSATHSGDAAFSADFEMSEGTVVCAARDGVVAEIKEDSSAGGNDARFERDWNFVRIRHKDGTVAFYGHLKKDGATVSVGDTVTTGQQIGLSGNTGYTRGPHLHFGVYIASDNASGRRVWTTIRWKFTDPIGMQYEPREGIEYSHDYSEL